MVINIDIQKPYKWHNENDAQYEARCKVEAEELAARPNTTLHVGDFLAANQGQLVDLQHSSRERFYLPRDRRVQGTSLLFQTLHDCYDLHRAISLSPQVIWYCILHEVAVTVNKYPELYRSLFTTEPTKQHLEVYIPGNPWDDNGIWIQEFEKMLMTRVPGGLTGQACQRFSTSTRESNISTLICFMDAASPYYSYGMTTCCGIPQVQLTGTPADWAQLAATAIELSVKFPGSLGLYFQYLIPVLIRLAAETAGQPQGQAFWESMFKLGGGSGGPYVNGWITCLWNYRTDHKGGFVQKSANYFDWEHTVMDRGLTPDQFTGHVSTVPFVWTWEDGSKHDMKFYGGILGCEFDGTFYEPQLAWAVGGA